MALSEEQKKKGAKFHALSLLTLDIFNNRFSELQQLYESLNLKDNQKILDKLDEDRNIGYDFTKMVYMDMILVIADYIDVRPEINDLFRSLYKKRFPYVAKIFNEIESNFKATGRVYLSKKLKFSVSESHFFYYLVYLSEAIVDPEKHFSTLNYQEDISGLYNAFYLSDRNLIDDQLHFDGDKDETILDSIFFEKYLKKRRIELAEYVGVEESSLDEYIHSVMKSNSADGVVTHKDGRIGVIEDCTRDIIANQNGGAAWFNSMTTTSNTMSDMVSVKYIPDVSFLIRTYYKSIVIEKYVDNLSSKKSFNKLTLSRECTTGSYELDFNIILCMYEMDVLYKMFSMMMKQYYRDFSWEKITNQGITQRYEKIVEDLEKVVSEKEKKIETLARKNESLVLQSTIKDSKDMSPFVSENNKLLKQLEDKDEEIEQLKQRLEWQEEFISVLSAPEQEEHNNIYDLEQLQTKRYLFVGRLDNYSELKHDFPNSVFMDKETVDISGVKVDAVVMLIKAMSHSMFYKVKASKILNDVPCVMCNTKSLDGILQTLNDVYFS